MPRRPCNAALILAALAIAGCARTGPAETPQEFGIDPAAPVAAGHAALPLPGEPTPLQGRALSGLYATPPSADTLAALSTAPVSPDGMYRAVLEDGAIWITRIDGAWLWQVALPPVAAPPAGETGQGAGGQGTGQQAAAGQGAGGQAAAGQGVDGQPLVDPADLRPVAPIQWTPRSTLLFRDTAQRWLEADPDTALVTPLSAFLTGVADLTPSPDGSQVLFYKENRLYIARWDGSEPQFIGENLVGHWDSSGQLVTEKRPETGTAEPD